MAGIEMAGRLETTQGFTPTFSITVPETTDLTAVNNVYVSLRQGRTKIRKSTNELVIAPHQVDVYLSQQDTLKFSTSVVEMQLNFTLPGGRRGGSPIIFIDINPNIELEVLE